MAARDKQGEGRASFLMVEELFDAGDDRFVSELRGCRGAKALGAFARRWSHDPRAWARRQIFAYLAEPLNRPDHHPLVKRLFKTAEERGDHELMGAFLWALDLTVRRQRRTRWRWDQQQRCSVAEEQLYQPRRSILPRSHQEFRDPSTGQRLRRPVRCTEEHRLFSLHTRRYLRRRAWRYFRRLGYARPAEYLPAVCGALARYRDGDLERGENILDSWGLAHICFGASEVLRRSASQVSLGPDRTLAELEAAPYFPSLWQAPAAAEALLDLLTRAESRLVRVFCVQLLRRHHAGGLAGLPAGRLLSLLDHADSEVQALAAELLQGSQTLGALPLDHWLELLSTRNLVALGTLCELMQRHVSSRRLTPKQVVDLACHEAAPVARLGLRFLHEKREPLVQDPTNLLGLAEARCAALGAEVCRFALSHLGLPGAYRVEHVIPFLDSLLAEVRLEAWAWLAPGSPGWNDPALWSRLVETPYEDLRLRLVETLDRRSRLPGAAAEGLAAVWCAVLLGVHRGGRQKLRAVRQVAGELARAPERWAELLPVLAVALRSVRRPEARAGLAAVVTCALHSLELRRAAAELLPELDLMPGEEAVR